jgi:hypothetical protein
MTLPYLGYFLSLLQKIHQYMAILMFAAFCCSFAENPSFFKWADLYHLDH